MKDKNKSNVKIYVIIAALLAVCAAVSIGIASCGEKNGDYEYQPADTISFIAEPETTEEQQTEPVTTEEETEAETEPPYVEPKKISFMGMGDNIIYRSTYTQSEIGGGKYDFKPKYKEGVRALISDADIAFVNQETAMCGEKYGYHTYPQFNTPQDMGYDLVEMGFDVISFANNHMADMGHVYETKEYFPDSVSDMIDFTDKLDAFIIGLYRDFNDFENIRVYEKDGVKIAFLAYTYGTNIYHNQTTTPQLNNCYLPVYDEETVTRQVKAARELADFVFVSVHWGEEGATKPNEEQKRYAKLMADLHVDVILGHHPHVIQSIEWIEGVDGNRTLCYYSLGNSMNAQDKLINMVGITANFDIVVDGDGKRIENARCTPLFMVHTPRYKNQRLILLQDLTDEICESHHCNVTDQKVTVQKARNIVTNTIAEEFLPDYLK